MAQHRDYDLGIVISPDVGDEQARAIVDRITNTVTSNDGQVVRVNAVGRRRLAYSIDHHRDGLYFFFDLIMPPTLVSEIERVLRVNEDVMRHLLLVRDPRGVAQQRQRDAEADAQAAQRAADQAARAAEQAAAAAAAAEMPAASEPATEAPAAEELVAEAPATEAAPAETDQAEEATTAEAEANA